MVKHESEYDISDASDYNPDLRGNLEAQIANVADELAYTAHDLDDGLRSGMLTPKKLGGIALWEILIDNIKWRGPELEEVARHKLIRQLIGMEVTDLITSTDTRLKDCKAQSPLDIQKLSYNVIGFSEEMSRRNRELKDFLYNKMYRHYRVVRMQTKAERIIEDIFAAYQGEPATLPDQFQAFIEQRGRERTICDYIAGMTDRYAIEEHQKLFDPLKKP
jgi:dGTPase